MSRRRLTNHKTAVVQAHRVDGDRDQTRAVTADALSAMQHGFDPLSDFDAFIALQDGGFDWDDLPTADRLAAVYTRSAPDIARYRDDDQRIVVQANGLVLHARSATRQGQGTRAAAYGLSALNRVKSAAGTSERLIELMRSPEPSMVGEACTAVIAIGPTTARLPGVKALKRDELLAEYRLYARALFLKNPNPPAYQRAHAAAAQSLFAESKFPTDPEFFWALVEAEARLRPDDSRGRATRKLIDVAIGEYTGVDELARIALAQARREMAAAGLSRALRAMEARKWVPRQMAA
jgi:hypothetical protein